MSTVLGISRGGGDSPLERLTGEAAALGILDA
jgi:hypothetical protein